MAEETKYQQFWSNLNSHLKSHAPEAVKRYMGRLQSPVEKQGDYLYTDDSTSCTYFRNDILALAFANGKPGFEYKERPECAALMLKEKTKRRIQGKW